MNEIYLFAKSAAATTWYCITKNNNHTYTAQTINLETTPKEIQTWYAKNKIDDLELHAYTSLEHTTLIITSDCLFPCHKRASEVKWPFNTEPEEILDNETLTLQNNTTIKKSFCC